MNSDDNLNLTTVDSLLSEIEREIPLTAKRQLSLHEIGDETMDKIVRHNTRSNSNVGADDSKSANADKSEQQLFLESRHNRSVMFSDKFELHEYPGAESSLIGEHPTEAASDVVAWDLSVTTQSCPKEKYTKENVVADNLPARPGLDYNDNGLSASDSSDSSLDITEAELRANSVTNLHERLDHVLGSKHGSPNVPKLKEMVNNADQMAFAAPENHLPSQPLKIKFESTPPLLSNDADAAHKFLEFELEPAHSEEETFNNVQHSPSKIPTTNTIRINRLASAELLAGTGQSRVSSGSSMDESVTDLETTMRQDKFQLLRTYVPSNNAAHSSTHTYQLPNKSLSILEPDVNTSRVFSVATTADEFQSARESDWSSSSSVNDDRIEQSIKDLQISTGFVREDETLEDISKEVKKDEQYSNGFSIPTYTRERPIFLPKTSDEENSMLKSISNSTVKLTDLNHIGNATLNDQEVIEDDNCSHISSPVEYQGHIEKDNDNGDQSRTGNSTASNGGNFAVGQKEIRSQTGDIIPLCTGSNGEQNLNVQDIPFDDKDELENIEIQKGENSLCHSEPGDSSLENNTEKHTAEGHESEQLLIHNRIASNNFATLFDDDPIFADVGDTSQDSVDITYSLKPDYLSIWHCQEGIKKSSPTISANSQFSNHSAGTADSSLVAPSKFRLKPRLVSRSKIHYSHHQRAHSPLLRSKIESAATSSILDPQASEVRGTRPPVQQIPSIAQIALIQSESKSCNAPQEGSKEPSQDEDIELPGKIVEESFSKPTDVNEAPVEKNEDLVQTASDSLYLPELSTTKFSFMEDFGDILKNMNQDNISLKHSERQLEDPTVYHIWDENNYENGLNFSFNKRDGEAARDALNDKVIKKLLVGSPNSNANQEAENTLTGLGILKKADSDVAICRTESFNGYEVSRCASSESVEHNRDLFQSPKTPSPIKKSHVESPFKTIRSRKLMEQAENNTQPELENVSKNFELSEPKLSTPSPKISIHSSVKDFTKDGKEVVTDLQDSGKLYIMIKSIKNLSLNDTLRHKPKIAMEFDNGVNVAQTAWKPLSGDGMDVNEEYELIMEQVNPKTVPEIIVTLKCKYERPTSELVEVVERIPVKKKFLFGKQKYVVNKKFVSKKIGVDSWDYKFAQDGSFARCSFSLNEEKLDQCTYRTKTFNMHLFNEWEREDGRVEAGQDIFSLPRKPKYKIGEIQIEMCFLPRTSQLEKFPKTLKLAHDIVNKYSEQQDTKFEGFLWQEGGDIDGMLQKRYFVLNGTQLVAHHEITRKPQAMINLLKVVSVVGEGKLTETAVQRVRNFTDVVLFSECFKLIFENGEVINLDAESADDKNTWTNLLSHVVDLNKFHQPWVKHVLNNSRLSV
ncbi:LADA_0H11188g1_1 [Lachancea dasiensis]|uniref:LADA_0H11188g1_1 n=1 Tax=Lachancea dasiensis TaxID=1072105 RepID=A0A1G4K3M1_9SACH|nr:LADA_0H11188g1_1 [Lachancea dasiensis]